MISFELTEPSFDKKKTTEYELSVLIGADSLSYCIIDKTNRVLSVVKCDFPEMSEGKGYADRLETIILRNVQLQQSYRAVYVGVFNLSSTLVPTRLYDADDKSAYLERVLPLSENFEIWVDSLVSAGAEHLYVIEDSLSKVLKSYFSGAEIIHSTSALYRGIRHFAQEKLGKCIFLNVRPEALQITFFDNGELVFYNTFAYSSSKDFIYYVMLVYDQFNLKPDTIPIHLSGELMEDSEMYHLIYRYIRNLKIIDTPEWIELSGQWINRPQHWFYDLFCLSLMKM
jgi:hypothetical protein